MSDDPIVDLIIATINPAVHGFKLVGLLKLWNLKDAQLQRLHDHWRNNGMCIHKDLAYCFMPRPFWKGQTGVIGYESKQTTYHWPSSCKCAK